MSFNLFWTDAHLSQSILYLSGEILVKSIIVAVVALTLIRLVSNSSASLRHVIASTALFAILWVPVGVLALPSWNIFPKFSHSPSPNLQSTFETKLALGSSIHTSSAPSFGQSSKGNPELVSTRQATPDSSVPPTSSPTLGALFIMSWLIGTTTFLWLVIRQVFVLYRHAMTCQACEDERVLQMVYKQAQTFRLNPPQVLICHQQHLPMVWGILRPLMVLPSSAKNWPDPQLNDVIAHEIAHLKRRDPLTITIGQFAKALYWFNPLVWKLNRLMVLEQESACDNHVIRRTDDQTKYAAMILEMTTIPQPGQTNSPVSVAMARPLQIERRIRAILSSRENRNPTSFLRVLSLLAFALVGSGFVCSISAENQTKAIGLPPNGGPDFADNMLTFQNNETIQQAVRYLESVQQQDGSFSTQQGTIFQNGTASLATIALLHVGEIADQDKRTRALDHVSQLNPSATYDIALTLLALCHLDREEDGAKIAELIAKLDEFQAKAGQFAGGWSYEKAERRADGSNTRFAVWALTVAHQRGHEVPAETMDLATNYWLKTKRADGGWSYAGPAAPRTATMTMSGVACLSWLRPMLEADDPRHPDIETAIVEAWSLPGLERALQADRNWPLYAWQIYSLAARATDRELENLDVGAIPSAKQLNDYLREIQKADGSFGRAGFEAIATSLAILAAEK